MQRPLNSIFLLYVIMAIPSYELLIDLITDNRYYAEMMHISGVISIYLLVSSLAITPATLLIKRWPWRITLGRWLLPRRRHFGLGSFYYACLHVIHYVRQVDDFEVVLLEALDFELAIAWIAFFISLILALTSNNASVKRLKTKWKKLHTLVYIGAILTFWHWLLFDFFPDQALIWIAIAILIKTAHIGVKRARQPAPIKLR